VSLLFTIDENKAFLTNQKEKRGYCLGTTKCALGNIISLLEEFPNEPLLSTAENIIDYITDRLSGKRKNKTSEILEMHVCNSDVHFIQNLLIDDFDNKEKITLTMRTVEDIRIKYHINVSYFPKSRLNYSEGAIFEVQDIKEVVYALLYYYALNDLKLAKCEHCRRWFAIDTFKIKYCTRKSIVDGYTHLCCEQAVRNILQRIYENKKKIYNLMTAYQQNYGNEKVNNFLDKYAQYSKCAKRFSAENLSEWLRFLTKFRKELKNGKHNPENE